MNSIFAKIPWMLIALAIMVINVFSSKSKLVNAAHLNPRIQNLEKFPIIESESLAGESVRLPEAIEGQVALITVAFFESGQPYVDSWAEPYLEEFYPKEGFDYFEVPMINDMPQASREFIDSGMRAGIPEEMHPNVVTFYGDYTPYLKALGISDLSSGYAFLVDREGTIIYRGAGMMKEENWEEIKGILREKN